MRDIRFPTEPQAEEALLCSILLFPEEAWPAASSIVEPEDLDDPTHRKIFEIIRELTAAGDVPDETSVAAKLVPHLRDKAYNRVATLLKATNTSANCATYARIVKRAAEQRRLMRAALRVLEYGERQEDVEVMALDMMKAAQSVSGETAGDGDLSLEEMMQDATWDLSKPADHLTTGVRVLDEKLDGGFMRGSFVIIGGRPSVGKTSLTLQMILGMARAGLRCGFVSCEMSRYEIRGKLLSMYALIDNVKIRRGLSGTDLKLAERARTELGRLPIYYYDGGGLAASAVWSFLERRVLKDRLDIIALDYIQLLRSAGQTRREEAGLVSQALKNIAKQRGIISIGVSQLSRPPKDRRKEQPTLASLKESGDLEQDADIVLFLHRPDITSEESNVTIIIAKNRHGRTGKFQAAWVGRYTRVEALETHRTEPPGSRPRDCGGKDEKEDTFFRGDGTGATEDVPF